MAIHNNNESPLTIRTPKSLSTIALVELCENIAVELLMGEEGPSIERGCNVGEVAQTSETVDEVATGLFG